MLYKSSSCHSGTAAAMGGSLLRLLSFSPACTLGAEHWAGGRAGGRAAGRLSSESRARMAVREQRGERILPLRRKLLPPSLPRKQQ